MAGLLRSPPWPGIDPAVASIDDGPRLAAGRAADERGLVALLVRQRVGGGFWQPQVPGRRRLLVTSVGRPIPSVPTDDTLIVADGRPGRLARRAGFAVVSRQVDPWRLLDDVEDIVCDPQDEIGLLGLASGKRVVDHDGTVIGNGDPAFVGRLLLRRHYRNPVDGASIDAAAAIALLGRWRGLIDANRGIAAATGMAFWKRREVARLLFDGRSGKLPFRRPSAALRLAARAGGAVAAWPARVPTDFAARAAAAGVAVRWVEDGYLRSAGLGSDLLPPLSLVVDDRWPYFDPARASQLEAILASGSFDDDLLARAAELRRTIVERRIGKYHVGGADEKLGLPANRRVVVVIGQVEDDLSVLRGGDGMTNLALISRVRAIEPGAYIVYRPHPDVEAGHRRGAIPTSAAIKVVDAVDHRGSLDALMSRADALHTLTSLTGFEALLRNVHVVVHGAPFYAGWGLTEDRGPPMPRRSRRLTLDQLVAGALIAYPRYLDPRYGLPCEPELFIKALGGLGGDVGWLVRFRRWQGRFRRRMGWYQ